MDFIVLRFNVKFKLGLPGLPDSFPQWGMVYLCNYRENNKTRQKFRIKRVSHSEAARIIKKNGFTEVLSNEDGRVYDTPEKSFLERYKGMGLLIPEDIGAE